MQTEQRYAVLLVNIPFVSEERTFASGYRLVGDRKARMRCLDAPSLPTSRGAQSVP